MEVKHTMKVAPNSESQKKYTAEYFTEERFLKNVYTYEHCQHKQQMLHIGFNISGDFCRPLGVTIVSILENSADLDFTFHIFIDEISEADRKKFAETVEKYQQNCVIYVLNIKEFSGFHIKHKRFKYVSYFRLYMSKILRKVTDKFIYLDADLICLRSLKPFLDVDFEGKTIAADQDLPNAVKERSAYLGLEHGNYLDSGVMIIDCRAWETRHCTERCFAYQGVPAEKFTCHDQDVLNLVFDGDTKYLDDRFNFLGAYGRKAPEDCMIYHFFGREKPWNIALRSIEKQWRYYLKLSLWDDIEGELPPKKGANYFYYKRAAKYYKLKRKPFKQFKALFWYSVLKIVNYF